MLVSLVGVAHEPLTAESMSAATAENPHQTVLKTAKQVVTALQKHDAESLAAFIHPKKGVRFSPYSYVDPHNDRKLKAVQISQLFAESPSFVWGSYDGSGDPIKLSPIKYLKRFVLNRDFSRPDEVHINEDIHRGTTANNIAEIYPNSKRVEYFIKPTVQDGAEQNDWASLTLVFEQVGQTWYLVGIIHGQWTV